MSCCPDKPILAGFLGSVAACPLPALAGRHDGRYMSDTTASQHPVFELHNSTFATSTCSLIKLSQKTEGCETTLYDYQNASLLFGWKRCASGATVCRRLHAV